MTTSESANSQWAYYTSSRITDARAKYLCIGVDCPHWWQARKAAAIVASLSVCAGMTCLIKVDTSCPIALIHIYHTWYLMKKSILDEMSRIRSLTSISLGWGRASVCIQSWRRLSPMAFQSTLALVCILLVYSVACFTSTVVTSFSVVTKMAQFIKSSATSTRALIHIYQRIINEDNKGNR